MQTKLLLVSIFSAASPVLAVTCNTQGFVPCGFANAYTGSTTSYFTPSVIGGSAGTSGGSGLWSSVNSGAGDPIQIGGDDGGDTKRDLSERQNALCCRPAPVQCKSLTTDGTTIPFCYVRKAFTLVRKCQHANALFG